MVLLGVHINILSLLIFCCYAAKAVPEIKFKSGITVPGTKWCGPDNTASHCEDFGIFEDADRCCRSHDYCEPYIGPKESLHGLYNPDEITRLECNCDEALFKCLSRCSGFAAWAIKTAYFGYQRACFKFDYPIKRCLRYEGFFNCYCVEYELDKKLPKKWQWFDNPQ